MKNLKTYLLLVILVLSVSSLAIAKDCTYTADVNDFSLNWTAYKTPAKAPVGGRFKELGIAKDVKTNSIKSLLQGITFEIDATSTRTRNTGRDAKIVKFFFQKMVGGMSIKGKTLKFEKDILKVAITMNGKTNIVPLKTEISPNKIIASGVIDVCDFAMNSALASMTMACEKLHQGKTWNDVAVKLSINYEKSCK